MPKENAPSTEELRRLLRGMFDALDNLGASGRTQVYVAAHALAVSAVALDVPIEVTLNLFLDAYRRAKKLGDEYDGPRP